MEIRLLRYFLAAAREENITRAAKTLHIAQPSLSKQLMELERDLGKQLIIRGKRKITLTEEGLLLRKRAEEIIMLCEKTERDISQDSTFIVGDVSISGAASETVSRAIAGMISRYPHVRFHFLNGDAEKIGEEIERGTLDFAILLEPVDLTKYAYIPLPESAEWGFFMHKDCPFAQKETIRPQDVRAMPLILPQRLELQRKLAVWAGVEIEELHTAATFDIFFNGPVQFLKKGLGYAFGPNLLLDTEESKTLCFRPLDPPVRTGYGLVWKRYPAFSKAAGKFIEEIKRETVIPA